MSGDLLQEFCRFLDSVMPADHADHVVCRGAVSRGQGKPTDWLSTRRSGL
jgi:hypothetical protein